jgi:tetratricopeptide (TPR) repeat protein
MVSLYSAVPDRWAKELFDFCQRFSTAGLSQVAVRGYECLIAKTNQAGELSQIIGNSAEAWVELESQMGTLSPASLRRLPSSVVDRSKALSELRPWIENPPGPDFVYWQGSFLRRHIAASALRALGQYQRISGQPEQAVNLYQKSLNLAPPYYVYTEELRDRPIVGLDAALDLAALFQAFPRLDPKGEQFRKLENELLEEKTMAYVEKNLVAVQKFHTVLGVIYAERGR